MCRQRGGEGIVLIGSRNSGKTMTFKKLFEMILERYNGQIEFLNENGEDRVEMVNEDEDYYSTFRIGDNIIGLSTFGDLNEEVINVILPEFVDHGCDIVMFPIRKKRYLIKRAIRDSGYTRRKIRIEPIDSNDNDEIAQAKEDKAHELFSELLECMSQ